MNDQKTPDRAPRQASSTARRGTRLTQSRPFNILKRLLANPWLGVPFWVAFWVGIVFGGWLTLLTVKHALFLQRTGLDAGGSSVVRMAAKEMVTDILKPWYDYKLLSTTSLPIYDLTLSDRRLDEWQGILERVTARGKSVPEDQVYIPATFTDGETTYRVDIRGRGTLAGHYNPDKPSIRVRFPSDKYFEGNRVINFIIPYEQTRIVVDTTLNAVARHYGLVAYPRGFAVLRMNGEVLGVYQLMEHWRKEMPVKQGRSEGYIISGFAEGKGGAETAGHPGFQLARGALLACDRGCPEDQARDLLDRFFDFEKMATYNAITTWFESEHAWFPDNLMLFFDPGRGRFEPIPWDVGIHPIYFGAGADEHPERMFESTTDLGAAFLALDDFRQRRNEILWDILHRKEHFALEESTRQFQEIEPDLDFDTEYSRKRTRRFYDGFQRIIRGNTKLLKGVLEQRRLWVEPVTGEDGTVSGLRLTNEAAASVDLDALRVTLTTGQTADGQTVTGQTADGQTVELNVTDRSVPGRWMEALGTLELPWPVEAPAVDAAAVGSATVEVMGRNAISGAALVAEDVHRGAPAPVEIEATGGHGGAPTLTALEAAMANSDGPVIPDVPAVAPVRTLALGDLPPFDGVRRTTEEGIERWTFSGTVRVQESVALPEGVAVTFEPGLRLELDRDVVLVIRGDLESEGTAERPILVTATDVEQPFATFAVLGRSHRPAMVRVAHTTVQRGREGDFDGVHFLGMFSIYDGSLDMRSSAIVRSAGEDGLNVKFGTVTIEDSRFESTAGDALDLDFCLARLERNTVRGSAADGFDFSGSVVTVRDNLFASLADKGISVGEQSTVEVLGNRFESSTTGVAVKDLSVAVLHGNHYRDLEVGVAIYRKKQVFGSGVVEYAPASVESVATEYLEDPGATIHRVGSKPGP